MEILQQLFHTLSISGSKYFRFQGIVTEKEPDYITPK